MLDEKGTDRGGFDEKGTDRGAFDKGTDRGAFDKGTDRGSMDVVHSILSSAGGLGGFLVVAFVTPIAPSNGNGNGAATRIRRNVGNVGRGARKTSRGGGRRAAQR